MRRDPMDTEFSLLIRLRDNFTCQRCGAKHERNSKGLHCAHGLGRRSQVTRWYKKNAMALCYGCHSLVDSEPDEKWKVWDKKFYPGIKSELTRYRDSGVKVDKVKIRKEIKEELKLYDSLQS